MSTDTFTGASFNRCYEFFKNLFGTKVINTPLQAVVEIRKPKNVPDIPLSEINLSSFHNNITHRTDANDPNETPLQKITDEKLDGSLFKLSNTDSSSLFSIKDLDDQLLNVPENFIGPST